MRASQPLDRSLSQRLSSFEREPRWVDWGRYPRHRVPAELRDWLWERGSLTRRVIAHCQGPFRVRLLRQSVGRPLGSERRLLAMPAGEQAVVREVELLCGGQPWVFARTLLPLANLGGAMRRLTRLGTRPLGEVLFTATDVERLVVEVAELDPNDGIYRVASAHLLEPPERLWGRRALYALAGKFLLVNEIFLVSRWRKGAVEAP